MSRSPRGFSLLEVMMGMMILAIVATGALLAFVASNKSMKDGQVRQYKMVLADAALQRIKLAKKTTLLSELATFAITPQSFALLAADGTPPNSAVWVVDPTLPDASPALPHDLSVGAYFTVLADGEVTPITTIPTGTPCLAAVFPTGTIYCREILVETELAGHPELRPGVPAGGIPALTLAGANVTTYWVRVYQQTDANTAHIVVQREVSIQ